MSGGSAPNQYKDWSRTDDVVNVLSSIAKSQKVKDAISKGIAAIVDQASGNLGGTENITNQYIDEVINNIGVVAAVTKADAKKLLKRSVDALVNLRKQPIKKAHNGGGPVEEDDPVLEVLLRIQRLLEEMADEDEDEPVEKAGYDPDQPRDESGQWSSSGGGGLTEGELTDKLQSLKMEEETVSKEFERLRVMNPPEGTKEYDAWGRASDKLTELYDEQDWLKSQLNLFKDPRAKDGGGMWGQVDMRAFDYDRNSEDGLSDKGREQLDEVVRRFAVPQDTTLYRGVIGDYAESLATAKPGELFELSKTASTSNDRAIALPYALGESPEFFDFDNNPKPLAASSKHNVMLEIVVPKGTPGMRARAVQEPTDTWAARIIESEWFLPRGTRLRIDSVSQKIEGIRSWKDNSVIRKPVTIISASIVKDNSHAQDPQG